MRNFVISPSNSLHPVFFPFWKDKFCVSLRRKYLDPPEKLLSLSLIYQTTLFLIFPPFFFFCSFHPSYFTSYQTHPKIAFIIVSFSYASMCHLMSNHCTLPCDGSSLVSKVTRSKLGLLSLRASVEKSLA